MPKVIFILQRRADTSLEEMRERWSGQDHLSKIRQLPGLETVVQNYVLASPAGHVCDGVGELWFDSQAEMERALNSPQMEAAIESAKTFLDMEKTGMVIVEEQAVIGAEHSSTGPS